MVKVKTDVHYRILNLRTSTYFTLSGDDNTSIVGNAFSGENDQLWTFEGAGSKKVYYIKSVKTGSYAGVTSDNVVQNQQLSDISTEFGWKVIDVDNMDAAAKFQVSTGDDLYIDLYNSDADDGTVIQLFPAEGGGNNQIWVLARAT